MNLGAISLFVILLLVNCGEELPVDDNVQFFNDDKFVIYNDVDFSCYDSEILDDGSLMLAGYNASRDQSLMIIDSTLTIG